MKSTFRKFALLGGCIATLALPATAAPLARSDIAANCGWLLHLDCDALRPTTVGNYIWAQMDSPQAKARLAVFQSLVGLDLRTQLHGVTVFGPDASPQNAVLIIYADFDAGKLANLAKAAKGSQSSLHNQIVVYNWLDEQKAGTGGNPRVYAAIDGNRVIFTQSEQCMDGALDSILGLTPSLAGGSAFADLGVPGNSHFVEAGAQKINLPDTAPNAALLRLSQSVELTLGETQNNFVGSVALIADNAAVASNIASIAQGLVSLMKLQTDKPEGVQLANAITVQQAGSGVNVTLSLPAVNVVEIMKADAARKQGSQ